LLNRKARLETERLAILFVDGASWSWGELRRHVRAHAAGLQELGVGRDEHVLSWLPNGPTAVLNLLALNMIGAVYVPINTAYRGALLEHVIANSGARRMILSGTLADRLIGLDTARLETLIVEGEAPAGLSRLRCIDAALLTGDPEAFKPPAAPIEAWDTQMVIYTSGTTGPSKGVLSSYRHARTAALAFRNVGPSDRNLAMMPMFHVGGVYGVLWALYHDDASVVVTDRFRTTDFWRIVRDYGVTTTGLLGSMVEFLNGMPEAADDRSHGLRDVLVAPYGEGALHFAARFGVDVYTEFNMTELSVPLFAGPNPPAVGTCGQPRGGVELRLVDTNDMPVPVGAPGELMLRTDEPWTLSHGYHNDPAATAAAWRNGWFHTGDVFRRDAAGNYFFLDRAKDAVRRRGENISSFEVEAAVRRFAAVAEVAVIAVPDDAGVEDEVMAVITVRDDMSLDTDALLAFLTPRLPRFMLPRT
jgi:crotonobetaine/carnitine-CoA ligase